MNNNKKVSTKKVPIYNKCISSCRVKINFGRRRIFLAPHMTIRYVTIYPSKSIKYQPFLIQMSHYYETFLFNKNLEADLPDKEVEGKLAKFLIKYS